MKTLLNFLKISLFLILFSTTLSFTAQAKETLQIVQNQKVCMVTNMVFPRDQIPVTHAGKTYYGCCENCKKTLSEDASARIAIDPVTKSKVDKASAVIAARADGSVIYFENKKTFEHYQRTGVK